MMMQKINITLIILIAYLCAFVSGCKKQDPLKDYCNATYTIIDNDTVIVSIPNAFTPNGDGANDIFIPVVYSDSYYVASTTILKSNILLFHHDGGGFSFWDGTHNGLKQPEGVYNFEVTIESVYPGKSFTKTGVLCLFSTNCIARDALSKCQFSTGFNSDKTYNSFDTPGETVCP